MTLRRLERGLAILGLFMLVVSFTPVVNWWLGAVTGPMNDPAGDVLIVLGADSLGDVIGGASYWRTVYAMRAWRSGAWKRVLICGGPGSDGVLVSEQMRQFLICAGLPPEVIEVETQSRSTHENAVAASRILAGVPGKKVLLTSDYHMFRAYLAFRKQGVEVTPRPFPDAGKRIRSWYWRWPVFVDLSVEAGKDAYYYVRGWI